MNIAIISHLYPTNFLKFQGKFIQDHCNLLQEQIDLNASLYVPTPFSFPFTKRYIKNSSPIISNSISSKRVFYTSFPKRKLPRIAQHSISNKLASVLQEDGIELAHVHWLNPDGMIIPLLNKRGIKTVLTIHGSDWYQCYSNPHLLPIIKEILEATDRILYSGEKLKSDIEQIFPFAREKSEVIYNMVDTDVYFPVSEKERITSKINLNWNPQKKHVLTVANLREEKGIDLLIDSVLANRSLDDITFHIVGNYENTSYSKEIEKRIVSNKLKHIQIHPTVNPKQLIQYYHASDLYISPSRREAFGLALTEACFCGVPFLSTPAGVSTKLAELGYGKIANELPKSNLGIEIAALINTKLPPITTIKEMFGKEAFLKKLSAIYYSI